MEFSQRELRDMAISVIALAFILGRFTLSAFPVTLFIILIAFLSHELAHKFFAQKYGHEAEFKMWPVGLLIGVITAVLPLGIVFAAPGAVMISPIKKFAFRVAHLTKKEYGIIGLAGPATNIVLALLFLAASFYVTSEILVLTTKISFFLALFNLLPFPPLDGEKVFSWNKAAWLTAFAISFVGYYII